MNTKIFTKAIALFAKWRINIADDKVKHFVVGYEINSISFYVLFLALLLFKLAPAFLLAFVAALLLSTAAGIYKEIRDQIVYKGFDPIDFAATTMGGIVSSLINGGIACLVYLIYLLIFN